MDRMVTRATAMPRPAQLARQTSSAQESGHSAAAVALWTPSFVRRACRVCRAGFAGRDMQVARTTERSTPVSGSDPRRSLGSVS